MDDDNDEFDFYLDFDLDPDLFFLDPTVPPKPATDVSAKTPLPAPPRSTVSDDRRSVAPAPTPSYLKAAVGDKRNQRRHLRFKAENATARVRFKGLLSSLGLGRGNVVRSAINLSEGGALFLSNERIKPDTMVRVRIEIESPPDSLETEGIVRWCESSPRRPDQFYVGIQFQGLDSVQAKKLSQMREWFNSPEFRMKQVTRRRSPGSGPRTNA